MIFNGEWYFITQNRYLFTRVVGSTSWSVEPTLLKRAGGIYFITNWETVRGWCRLPVPRRFDRPQYCVKSKRVLATVTSADKTTRVTKNT